MKKFSDLAHMVTQGSGMTPETIARGWHEVEIGLRDGTKRTVRLTMVEPSQRKPLLFRFSSTNDSSVLLLALLPKELATDAFLDSVTPLSLMQLYNCALALMITFLAPELDTAGAGSESAPGAPLIRN